MGVESLKKPGKIEVYQLIQAYCKVIAAVGGGTAVSVK
jgi:hypothetical protein